MNKLVEYGFNDGDRTDPRWYENQPEMLDPATASVWALHLRVQPDGLWDVGINRSNEILRLASNGTASLTGEYTYGDSWAEWGKPAKGDDDKHLVLYFRAAPDEAWGIGAIIVATLELGVEGILRSEWVVTTSGDYAEQARRTVQGLAEQILQTPAVMRWVPPPDVPGHEPIRNKIEAIKETRSRFGVDLKDAKDAVELVQHWQQIGYHPPPAVSEEDEQRAVESVLKAMKKEAP